MDNRMIFVLVFGFVLLFLVLPARADVIVKDSISLVALGNVYYEKYRCPSLDLISFGLSDENGTIALINETIWLILKDSTHETRVVCVNENDTVYMSPKLSAQINLDADCGIVCNAPRIITKSCSCVCETQCPINMVQSEDCRCFFPILFSPMYSNTTELYSEYIATSRVTYQTANELHLIDSPENCQIVAKDFQGKIIKINPCEGLTDGMISCAFAVDDSFYIGEKYGVTIACGNAFKTFNVTITKPTNSLFFNKLVMYTRVPTQLGGLLIAMAVGAIFLGVLKW